MDCLPPVPAEPQLPCGHCSEPFDAHELIDWCEHCGADIHCACTQCAYVDEEPAAERGECQ